METGPKVASALARWVVVAPATDERLRPAERGLLLAELAAQVHLGPDGRAVRVTRRTLYRWLAAWQARGFDGLKPSPRRDAGAPRTDPELLALAAALRREAPARSAAQIAELLQRTRGLVVAERTLQRYFAQHGLERARLEGRHRAYGRFEAAAPADLWVADAWDGPAVAELGGRHAQLFTVLDDHTRLVCHGAFYPDVGERSFQHCLRTATGRRGLPRVLYTDNGAAFVSGQLKLICARLGVRTTHTPPYQPQGRGKQERYYRTVAEQSGVEADLAGAGTLADLNRWFAAWVEQVYHRRVHRTTGQTPLERWLAGVAGIRPAPEPAALARAFWWATQRTVSATRTVALAGRRCQVDPGLAGRRVELRYDPDDPATIWVFYQGTEVGRATPEVVGPHVGPRLRTTTPTEPGPPTGIAYLDAVPADHAHALRTQLSYQPPPVPPTPAGPDPAGHNPGTRTPDRSHHDPGKEQR